jgi:hypothetical protein
MVPVVAQGCATSVGSITADQARVDFEVVYVGQKRTYPIVIRNTGGAAVVISSVKVEGDGLSFTHALPRRVGRGASTWFTVTYAPRSAGVTSGAVSLQDGIGQAVALVGISGKAVALDASNSVSVASYGASGNGRTDDTMAFQAAARAAGSAGKVLYVRQPPGGEHYKLTGVVQIHGSVVGEPGSEKPEIRMYGANGSGRVGGADPYTVFYYKGNSAGTVITGLHLNGGRDFAPHTNVYGLPEQSHGIALQDVSNVRIENNVVENTQGDAVLVGGEPGTGPCSNVQIVDNVLRHPMRCAVSAMDTRRLKVFLNKISKLVEYQSAIDFEPNIVGQAVWDAEVAYNDFDKTLQHDHAIITSTIATKIPEPGGNIRVHDNWGARGKYSYYLDLTASGSVWQGNVIQASLPVSR